MWLSVVLAMATAFSNGASNVLQRKANKEEAGEGDEFSPKLIWHLLHRKTWVAGFALIVTSFLLQAGALRYGQLALVQPIIVAELPITLIGASIVFRSGLRRREWAAILLMSAGLAGLVGFMGPGGGGHHRVPALTWIIGVAVCVGIEAAAIALSRRRRGDRSAALLGAGAGIGFGLTAAFTKQAMTALSHGVPHFFGTWAPYAMALSGLGSMFLMQNALRAGSLVAAQPGITLLDPVVAILWGVFAFDEQVHTGLRLALAGLGGLLMIGGAVALSRSPLLAETQQPDRQPDSQSAGAQ